MRSHAVVALSTLFSPLALALGPIQVYQRWLMIIKPNAEAGGKWTGTLTQEQIDAAQTAFLDTWPRTIRELTDGAVEMETHVIVSDSPVQKVSDPESGMVTAECIPEDVKKYVSPDQWDGVAVYNAFTDHSFVGTSGDAGVGWFSVNQSPDLGYHEDALAGWIHESLHTMAWYFDDSRLGPVAPKCPDSPDGRDGVHCGEEFKYTAEGNGLGHWYSWYGDFLNGKIDGNLGLGPKAWKLGSRREKYLNMAPGSLIPKDGRRSNSSASATTASAPAASATPASVDVGSGSNSCKFRRN